MDALNYKQAGVDVEAGYEAVRRIKRQVQTTFNDCVRGDLGGFAGLYSLTEAKTMTEPILVAGTDGVGTKLKLALALDDHRTVGIDCVAMCVNDILCQGAKPLFFLDYIATEHIQPERIETIVGGMAEGCRQSAMALIGGETAEMPGFYPKGDYDLAGFCVGIVDRSKVIDGKQIREGDRLLGLPSSGLHSNGFSLVRRIIDQAKLDLTKPVYDYGVKNGEQTLTLGQILLEPTIIYYQALAPLLDKEVIKGLAHITGGGFYENIPRMLPDGLMAEIDVNSYRLPPVFDFLAEKGSLKRQEMYHTFNMGIGMVMAVADNQAMFVRNNLEGRGQEVVELGRVVAGNEGIRLCH